MIFSNIRRGLFKSEKLVTRKREFLVFLVVENDFVSGSFPNIICRAILYHIVSQ